MSDMNDMNQTTQFTFRLQNYTPKTMRFARLVEYYQHLATMLGKEHDMYLLEIRENCHASGLKIDPEAVPFVMKRLEKLRSGKAPRGAMKACARIDAMLAEDGTEATLEDHRGGKVIAFPIPETVPSREPAAAIRLRDHKISFVGEIYHIAESEQGVQDVNVRLKRDGYGKIYCITTKTLAKEMRQFLFENIRVCGHGYWTKNAKTGFWDMEKDVTITGFTPVVTETVREAIDRVRALDIDWPDDPLAALARFKDGAGP